MGLQDFLKDIQIKEVESINELMDTTQVEQTSALSGLSDGDYFDIVNPDTGLRYNIPMLDSGEPGYYFKYVYAMKLRERTPETFEKMLQWN